MTGSTQQFVPESLYTPDCPAVLCGSQSFSYARVFSAAHATGNNLTSLGIQPGDHVGILSPNTPEYLISLLALWKIGAVACPLSPRSPQNLIHQQRQAMNGHYCLTFPKIKNISQAGEIDLNTIVPPLNTVKGSEGKNFSYPLDQDATIIFTSGSSSRPKAVLHTMKNHFYSAKGSNEHIPVIPGDRWLLSLPLYHVGGLSILFRVFMGGGSLVIPDTDRIEDALKHHKITHLSLVPTQLIRLLRNQEARTRLKGLKAILLGGGPVPDPLIAAALEDGLPIYLTYGLTEMASQVATSNRLTKESRESVKILNYRRLMISEEGEILVRGEPLFKSYIGAARISIPFNENGYFATGDLGTFDNNGNLIVTGRKDNMFVSGGENIQPEEIEKCLCQIKGVDAAVVVPVTHPEFGFRPVAFIKVNSALNAPEALSSLKDYLPSFKIPDRFYQWPDGDTETTFKVNRGALARLANEGRATDLARTVL